MSTIERRLAAGSRWLRMTRWLVLALAVWVGASSAVMAKGKKKEEPAAAPTKSYTASYFIVILALTGGLMAVLRPGTRLDKMPEKIINDTED